MLSTIRSRIFCLLVCCIKAQNLGIKTLFVHVVMYRSQTWSLTLREEHRLKVIENRVLRRIFWPKRDKMAGSEENCKTRSFVTFAKYK
jgi:hypothetical protein